MKITFNGMAPTRIIALALLLATLAALRAALPAWIGHRINQGSRDKGGNGWKVEDVDVHLLKGSYDLEGVTLRRQDLAEPIFAAEKVTSTIRWENLFTSPLTVDMEAFHPRLYIFLDPEADRTGTGARPDWPKRLRRLTLFRVSGLYLRQGEIRFRDATARPEVEITARDVDLEAENLYRGGRDSSRRVSLRAEGRLMESGRFRLRTRLHPEAAGPSFDLDFSLQGMDLRTMNAALEAYAGLAVAKGRLDLEVHATARGDRYRGKIRSRLHDFELMDAGKKEAGFVQAVKEKAVEVLGAVLEKKTEANEARGKAPPESDFSGRMPEEAKDAWSMAEYLLKQAFRKGLNLPASP